VARFPQLSILQEVGELVVRLFSTASQLQRYCEYSRFQALFVEFPICPHSPSTSLEAPDIASDLYFYLD
jgi:hypothetical protein